LADWESNEPLKRRHEKNAVFESTQVPLGAFDDFTKFAGAIIGGRSICSTVLGGRLL
jgi:hypothetical protein